MSRIAFSADGLPMAKGGDPGRIGEHFCLGASLARLELRELFRQLVPRLGSIELAGPVERVRSSFLGGVKRMPIRYELEA